MTTWVELNEGVLYDAECLATAVFPSFIFDSVKIEHSCIGPEVNICGEISREDLKSRRHHGQFKWLDEEDFPEYVKLFETGEISVYIEITGFWDDDEEEDESIRGIFTITAEQVTDEVKNAFYSVDFPLVSIDTTTVPSKDYSTSRANQISRFVVGGKLRAINVITASMLTGCPTLGDSIIIDVNEQWNWDWDRQSFDGQHIRIFRDDEEFYVDPLWFEPVKD